MINPTEFNDTLYRVVGRRIKLLRQKKNITQAQMAEKTGISRSSLSNIESGNHQASLHNLYLIFNVLEEPLQAYLPIYGEILDQINSSSEDVKLAEDLKNQNLDEKSKKSIEEFIKKMDDDNQIH